MKIGVCQTCTRLVEGPDEGVAPRRRREVVEGRFDLGGSLPNQIGGHFDEQGRLARKLAEEGARGQPGLSADGRGAGARVTAVNEALGRGIQQQATSGGAADRLFEGSQRHRTAESRT